MNTEHRSQLQSFQRFAQVTAQRRRLPLADWELPGLPFAGRAANPQLERPQRGTAPRAKYFVEVYVARPVAASLDAQRR